MKVTLCLLFIFLMSCTINKNNITDANYYLIYENNYNGKENSSYKIISNYEDYISEIKQLSILEEEYNDLLKIDFSSANLIFLYTGEKSTSGYHTKIKKSYFKNNILYIEKEFVAPNKEDITLSVITKPISIYKIVKADSIVVK